MISNEKINLPHRIDIEISPNDADLAIVSIDDSGKHYDY